ncbi:hypothetical protein DYY88_11005 [Leptolyngbya iicbica LK]|uniref:Glycosyltransferase RgtA/B/C/D-like domain-containing protein n=2 Tax=Cyanophyceae TaxID=3028117 RepID=A0A4Q7E9P5_9CYAN|nr:hypothetical protein DYY88_11005 [Leptolyngbya sp. LK]
MVFWHDEVFTALRVTGHLGDQVAAQLFTGEPIAASAILQYQTFAPGSTFADTWRSLIDHPEHPPLFYLLGWVWVKVFGTSVTAFRSLSALISTVTFLALPGLAWELFAIREAAILAPLLFAVSPVHLLYAQEARQYALWTLVTVLATWALRRAVRLQRWRAWGTYAVCLSLTFYTSVLSLTIVMAHGIYGLLVLSQRQRHRFVLAIAAAGLLFMPWLLVMALNRQQWQSATDWTTVVSYPLDVLVKLWGLHFTAVFFDPNLPLEHPYSWLVPPLFVLLLLGILLSLLRSLSKESSVLVLTLVLVPTVCILGGDWVRGSVLSRNTRYFMPALIGCLVAMAGWLGLQYQYRRRAVLWGVALLLGLGLTSSWAILQAPAWWSKGFNYHNRTIAAAINEWPQPTVLTQAHETTLGNVISLSYYLAPETTWVITQSPELPQVPTAGQTVLLFEPTEQLLAQFACLPEALPVPGGLFRVACEAGDRSTGRLPSSQS